MCSDSQFHAHLDAGVNGHPAYFKSKHIARDLGRNDPRAAHSLGNLFRSLVDGKCAMFRATKWGYSKSTTWRVERR